MSEIETNRTVEELSSIHLRWIKSNEKLFSQTEWNSNSLIIFLLYESNWIGASDVEVPVHPSMPPSTVPRGTGAQLKIHICSFLSPLI